MASIGATILLFAGCFANNEDGFPEGEVTVKAPEATRSCQFKVIWAAAGVYEKPSNSSKLLKSKNAGDIVGGHCFTHYNSTEDHEYQAVATDSAKDDIGWMRRDALIKL